MEQQAAHHSLLRTSDFVIVTLILLSAIVELLVPSSFRMNRLVLSAVGVVVLIVAWVIIVTVKIQFKKHRQKTGPGHPTTTLISGGLFAYSRNPIYIGIALIPLSLGLLFDSIWTAASAPLSLGIMHYLLVLPEERYLLEQFGDEYCAYMRKVRRWL